MLVNQNMLSFGHLFNDTYHKAAVSQNLGVWLHPHGTLKCRKSGNGGMEGGKEEGADGGCKQSRRPSIIL